MPNSTLEQLQRDANKVGAYQAKIIYAQYLINQNSTDTLDNANQLLSSIHSNHTVPAEYRAQAWFWRAKYLEQKKGDEKSIIECYENVIELAKENGKLATEFNQARLVLLLVYKQSNSAKYTYYKNLGEKIRPRHRLVRTDDKTAEFLYKQLRLKFEKGDVTPELYRTKLNDLLKHKELTDTLTAKIYYQRIHVNLKLARDSGIFSYLEQAKENCQLLIKDPRLNAMGKAAKAKIILHRLNQVTPDFDEIVQAHLRRPQYKLATPANFLTRGLYAIKNGIYLYIRRKDRKKRAETQYKDKVKESAENVLNLPPNITPTGESNNTLFSKRNNSYGTITDRLSDTSMLVSGTDSELQPGELAYHRVTKKGEVRLTVKTLMNSTHTIESHQDMTIDQIKELLLNKYGYLPYQQRLVFAGKLLEDNHTVYEENIQDNSEICLVLKMRGD